jgi:hypothetical protein
VSSIPDRPWTARAERVIRREGVQPEDESILVRLLTDPRMDTVWTQLTRRSRTNPVQFFYSAAHDPGDPPLDAEEAQHRAMGMLLLQAFLSAKDKRRATPIEEVQSAQRQRREDAASLRRIADEIGRWAKNAGAYDRAHNDMVQIIADVQRAPPYSTHRLLRLLHEH